MTPSKLRKKELVLAHGCRGLESITSGKARHADWSLCHTGSGGGVNKWEKRGQEPTNPTPEPHPRDMLPPAKLYLPNVPPSPPKVNQVCGRSISHWSCHARQSGPWERRLPRAFSTLLQPITPFCSRRSFLSWILCLSFFKRFSLQFRFTFEVCLVIYALSNVVWVYWEIM